MSNEFVSCFLFPLVSLLFLLIRHPVYRLFFIVAKIVLIDTYTCQYSHPYSAVHSKIKVNYSAGGLCTVIEKIDAIEKLKEIFQERQIAFQQTPQPETPPPVAQDLSATPATQPTPPVCSPEAMLDKLAALERIFKPGQSPPPPGQYPSYFLSG